MTLPPERGDSPPGERPRAGGLLTAEACALAALATALVIWASLFRKPGAGEDWLPHLDKAKHFAAYAVLALAWARALSRIGLASRTAAIVAIALGASLGGATELLQPRFGRSCELLDEVANTLGSCVGALAWLRLVAGATPGLALARVLSALALSALPAGRLLAALAVCALVPLAQGGCGGGPTPRTVTVNAIPGRSAGISAESQAAAEREIEERRARGDPVAPGASGAGGQASPTSGAIALPPDEEARLLEQAGLRRMSGDALARDFYDALLARVIPRDRPFFRWLRARLEPTRGARRAAMTRAMGYAVRLHGALIDLGDMDFEEGRLDEARARWAEALRVDPASPRALARRAYFESGRASVESSLAAVRAFEARGSRLPDPFVARCHDRTSREARAGEILDAAIREDISAAIAARFVGERCYASGDLDGASRAFERALLRGPATIVPAAPYLRATLARVVRLAALGNPIAAEEAATTAGHREGPGTPPLMRYVSAAATLACGDRGLALERARDAAGRDVPGAPLGRLVAHALSTAGLSEAARLLDIAIIDETPTGRRSRPRMAPGVGDPGEGRAP